MQNGTDRPDDRDGAPVGVDIPIVEDDPHDVEFALRAFGTGPRLRVHVARDGAEALDDVFGDGRATRPPT